MPEKATACVHKDEKVADFSKYSTFWKTEVELMTRHIVISVVDAFVYIVLSMAGKQCLMGNYLAPKNV
jgi:hypothetical protein